MTRPIAGLYELTSGPMPEKPRAEDWDFPIRMGSLSGAGLGGIEDLGILPRRESPNGP